MPEQRKFPAWLKESIGVLVVLTGYGVLGAQFLMKYTNYPKDGGPAWMNPWWFLPEPFAWFIILLIFSDGVGGFGILSILITSAFVRIKYYWHWMAIVTVGITISKTIVEYIVRVVWYQKFFQNPHYSSGIPARKISAIIFDVLAQLASNGLFTLVLILFFALPLYFIRVHIHEKRLKAKTE